MGDGGKRGPAPQSTPPSSPTPPKEALGAGVGLLMHGRAPPNGTPLRPGPRAPGLRPQDSQPPGAPRHTSSAGGRSWAVQVQWEDSDGYGTAEAWDTVTEDGRRIGIH